MKTLVTTAVSLMIAVAATPSQAAVLTFDDVPTSGSTPIQLTSYQGYTFTNGFVINGANQGGGYAAGVVSSPNVFFNGFGNLASVSAVSAFSLTSAFFTSAFVDQTVTVIGYNGTAQVFSDTFNTLRSGPTLHVFSNASITSFSFVGSQSQVVIDNLTINASAVPETATWAMMIAGFGMMGAAMRTRRRSTKVSFA